MSNEHIFTCDGRPQLRVDVGAGILFVRGWDGDEVRVSDEAGAKVRQKGDKVFIDSSTSCALKIYLPRTSDVYIDGTNLEIDIAGINGNGIIDVSTGDISIEDWQGDLEIDGTSCNVRLSQCNGQVEIDTSDGGIEIHSSQGRFAVDTGSGSVTVEHCSGSLEADTGGGDVTLHKFKGPVHVDTGSGNVALKDISGRNVFADCGGGNIDAALPGISPGRWQLSTGSGRVTLQVPENISARFEFEGPRLDIEDLALEHSRQAGDRIVGTLNDGQGNVAVYSSTGDITARKAPAVIILDAEPEQEKDDESLKILTMLENGAITTAEAEKLLDALRGEENGNE